MRTFKGIWELEDGKGVVFYRFAHDDRGKGGEKVA